jgi:hypothetical protein
MRSRYLRRYWERFEKMRGVMSLDSGLRVEVTEYLRTAAGCFPEFSQSFVGALQELPLVGLEDAMLHGFESSGRGGGEASYSHAQQEAEKE